MVIRFSVWIMFGQFWQDSEKQVLNLKVFSMFLICLIMFVLSLEGWLFICSRVSISEVNLWFMGILVKCRLMFVLGWFNENDGLCVLLLLVFRVILLVRLMMFCSRFSSLWDLLLLSRDVMILNGWLIFFRQVFNWVLRLVFNMVQFFEIWVNVFLVDGIFVLYGVLVG